MRRVLSLAGLALAVLATTASAQKAAGDWNVKVLVGPRDSVGTTYGLHSTTTDKGWTVTFPGRAPLAVRVIAMGGDSAVTEVGPYSSALRPGQMVTTQLTSHFKGDAVTGTFTAKYANGDIVKGKISGTRKK